MPETRRLYLSPSIRAADFTKHGESCDMLKLGGADYLHVDVMDGHFVPNITIGIPVIKSLKKYSSLPLDCHLMISNPDTSVNDYINAGADILTIHVESSIHSVSYTHLRAHETVLDLVCRLLLEKKK